MTDNFLGKVKEIQQKQLTKDDNIIERKKQHPQNEEEKLSNLIFEIKEAIEDQNLLLIEDAAESLGASVQGKKVGSVSDSATFSFTGNKVLTTGEGGAIVTNSDEIYEKLKLIRSHGRVDKTNYFDNPLDPNYIDIGYNWRMPSLIAALGISQLAKFD